MDYEFRLPDIGEGVAEGEIVKWLVSEGDSVKEDDDIVEIMTDKATVTITSPVNGTIKTLLAEEGTVVPIGTIIVVFDAEGDLPTTMEHHSHDGSTHTPAAKAETAPKASAAASTVAPPKKTGPVRATPATRKLARELSVDLATVSGTGPKGRITEDDVRTASKNGTGVVTSTPESGPAQAPSEGEERIPLRGLRKRISEHMAHAKRTAAHFTYVEECDMTQLVELRRQLKPEAEERGIRMTYLPFIIRALVPALKKFPYLNAMLDEETQEVVLKKTYNIGIAVAAEDGLIVPNVKGVDAKTIWDVAKEIQDLSGKARDGKVALPDIQGGTFTITSIGNIGGVLATPILNHPEVAILGVNAIRKKPVVRDDQIVIRDMVYLSLSLDHRVVDGSVAALFMQKLIQGLEQPAIVGL